MKTQPEGIGGEDISDQELLVWIQELRGRLHRGELSKIGRVNLGGGVAFDDGELAVRIMLADFDDTYDLALDHPQADLRRSELMADFRQLWEQIA